MSDSLVEFLEKSMQRSVASNINAEEVRECLVCLEAFNRQHEFTPGQVVQWKQNLRNRKSKGPFVVVEVLKEPIINPSESAGSPYFREPLDIILGIKDSDGDFVCHHVDSRRLEPSDILERE